MIKHLDICALFAHIGATNTKGAPVNGQMKSRTVRVRDTARTTLKLEKGIHDFLEEQAEKGRWTIKDFFDHIIANFDPNRIDKNTPPNSNEEKTRKVYTMSQASFDKITDISKHNKIDRSNLVQAAISEYKTGLDINFISDTIKESRKELKAGLHEMINEWHKIKRHVDFFSAIDGDFRHTSTYLEDGLYQLLSLSNEKNARK